MSLSRGAASRSGNDGGPLGGLAGRCCSAWAATAVASPRGDLVPPLYCRALPAHWPGSRAWGQASKLHGGERKRVSAHAPRTFLQSTGHTEQRCGHHGWRPRGHRTLTAPPPARLPVTAAEPTLPRGRCAHTRSLCHSRSPRHLRPERARFHSIT